MSLDFGFAEEYKVEEKILINIGCLMDIPTGSFVKGAKDETIINGGLSHIFCIAGTGNNFKSTLLHHFMLSAAAKVREASDTRMLTYDTEINISIPRLQNLSKIFDVFKNEDIITGKDRKWTVVNKNGMPGEQWVEKLFDYMDKKASDKKILIKAEPFLSVYDGKPRVVPIPSFAELDSLSELDSMSIHKTLSGNLDSSDTNTYAMKLGGFKTKFFRQLPSRCDVSNTYFLATSHIGTTINMDAKPWEAPTKANNYLKAGDSLKGSSGKIFFLSTGLIQAHAAKAFYNQNTKGPEYPKDPNDVERNDLNIVSVSFLRNKTGASGITVEVLISQVEGVLPNLTEFHYIKSYKDKNYGEVSFGINGNDRSYHLILYPDVNLSRTTVRSKLDTDPKLKRAVNITAELLQLQNISDPEIKNIWCSPAELYEDIKKLGYDWNILLDTRGYWTFNQYSNPVPFLSTVDLLKMRKGIYKPYWLKEENSKKGK